MQNFTFRLIYFLFFIGSTTVAFSQSVNVDQYLQEIAAAESLTPQDISDYIVNNNHTSVRSSLEHFYLLQRYTEIEIHNTQSSFHISADGQLFRYNSLFIDNLDKKIVQSTPALSHIQALQSVINIFGYDGSILPTEISSEEGREQAKLFTGGSISQDDIPVKLMYYQRENGELHLCYDMNINEVDFSDWWSLKVDATTGEIVDQINWTVECNFEHDINGKHVCHDDHVCSDYTSIKESKIEKTKKAARTSNSAVMPSSYNVYPEPVESPNHGSRAIINDPENLSASPFGWHDTNGVAGAEFTTTRGNNVIAQDDENGNNGTGFSPNGGTALNFDFPIDFTMAPTVNRSASLTNLFYWNNLNHDIWYAYGFDEASGNFQENNYGNGGAGSDSVNADGLDGSGTNNANFSTPPEGGNPRMQMFLWTPSTLTQTTINSPTEIAGGINGVVGNFGAGTFNLTDDVVLANDGSAEPTLACGALTNGTAITGNIALIDRGTCEFGDKALNAQNAGAIAVIICQDSAEAPFAMGPGINGNQVTIPSIMISQQDCDSIKAYLPNVEITMSSNTSAVNIDGSFDNVIIGHEYGHGISIRLTGGSANSGCLNNSEQMGEGWSDWFGMMTTIEPTDDGTEGRGVGTYAISQPTIGGGIRAFPYSTDLTVDPRTYGDLPASGIPHGVGSVWCAMLWDLTWTFIDEFGFDPDLYNGTGGNNMVMELVIEALKLQPCSPGFVDGRDAILDADIALNGGANSCLIWEAFAKRGLGLNASQGSSASRSDGTEDFNVPIICNIVEVDKTVDKTAVIVGDTLTYTITYDNSTSLTRTNVAILDTLASCLVYVASSGTNGLTHNNGVVSITGQTIAPFTTETYTFQAILDPTITSTSQDFLDDIENGAGNWTLFNDNNTQLNWQVDATNPFQGTNSFFAENTGIFDIKALVLTNGLEVTSTSELRFWHTYSTLPNVDGGLVEISTDNQSTWTDLGSNFIQNGYDTSIDAGTGTSQAAFGGDNPTYVQTIADLSQFAGQRVSIRFLGFFFGNATGTGWNIDNIEITDTAVKTIENIAHFTAAGNTALSASISPATDIILGTCSDGIQNGTETGIDVGGSCPPATTPCDFDLTFNADPAEGGTFQVQNQITSSVDITTNTDYFASCILLENDFEVIIGTEFLADINPCTAFTSDAELELKVVSTGSKNNQKQTVIDVNIPIAGQYTLQLTQEDGSVMILPTQEFAKGVHRINVETEESFIPTKIDMVKE